MQDGQNLGGAVLTKFKAITGSIEDLRDARNKFPKLMNGGWHFSYLGGVDRIVEKLKSFSHTEYNLPEITSSQWIANKMKSGEDLFGRDSKFEFIDISHEFPFETTDLIQKYPYLVLDR